MKKERKLVSEMLKVFFSEWNAAKEMLTEYCNVEEKWNQRQAQIRKKEERAPEKVKRWYM